MERAPITAGQLEPGAGGTTKTPVQAPFCLLLFLSKIGSIQDIGDVEKKSDYVTNRTGIILWKEAQYMSE